MHCIIIQCQIKYSNTKLNRITLKSEKLAEEAGVSSDESLSSPPCKRRSSSQNDTIDNGANNVLICWFCREVDRVENLVAAGTFYAKKTSTDKKYVIKLAKTW